MADVEMTVGIGRAVVENKKGTSFSHLPHFFVKPFFFPLFHLAGFFIGQICLHGKPGHRQVQRFFVVHLSSTLGSIHLYMQCSNPGFTVPTSGLLRIHVKTHGLPTHEQSEMRTSITYFNHTKPLRSDAFPKIPPGKNGPCGAVAPYYQQNFVDVALSMWLCRCGTDKRLIFSSMMTRFYHHVQRKLIHKTVNSQFKTIQTKLSRTIGLFHMT